MCIVTRQNTVMSVNFCRVLTKWLTVSSFVFGVLRNWAKVSGYVFKQFGKNCNPNALKLALLFSSDFHLFQPHLKFRRDNCIWIKHKGATDSTEETHYLFYTVCIKWAAQLLNPLCSHNTWSLYFHQNPPKNLLNLCSQAVHSYYWRHQGYVLILFLGIWEFNHLWRSSHSTITQKWHMWVLGLLSLNFNST